jgi:hypothetical protein
MEIGWTDVGSGGYILVNCAHSNTRFFFSETALPNEPKFGEKHENDIHAHVYYQFDIYVAEFHIVS